MDSACLQMRFSWGQKVDSLAEWSSGGATEGPKENDYVLSS